jgi:D-alanyl-D-alanine carboxypeptidase
LLATLVITPIAIVRLTSASGSDQGREADSPSVARTTDSTARSSPPVATSPTGGIGASATQPAQSQGVDVPPCAVGDLPAEHASYDQWTSTLLDTTYRLPSSYQPPDLVPVREAGFPEANLLIRSFAVDDLRDLREAAADAGHPIDLVAAYRSYAEQKDLFDRRSEDQGQDAANKTARPGHSEHQLGTTIDVKARGAIDVTQAFGSTPTGGWMISNAYRYGFVQSYPTGRHDVTCYAYEPWHFRYLGRTRAAEEHASGLTLREFLWRELHPRG